jgi:small-conductance mechanosensitive channel
VSFDDISNWARGSGLEIVLIFLGAVLLVRFARWFLLRTPSRLRGEDRHKYALAQAMAWLATATIWAVAGMLILSKFNVPLTSVVPPAAVAGVAVGFGAQKIVADLLSGFFLFSERQLGYGDVVRISQPGTTSGVTGTVEELTLRTTRLRTTNGEVVFLPNGEIRQLTNLSLDWALIVIDIFLPADVDLEGAAEILEIAGAVMREEPRWSSTLLDDPHVTSVDTQESGDLRMRLSVRVRATARVEADRALRRRVIAALRQAGIRPAVPLATSGESRGR